MNMKRKANDANLVRIEGIPQVTESAYQNSGKTKKFSFNVCLSTRPRLQSQNHPTYYRWKLGNVTIHDFTGFTGFNVYTENSS